MSMEELISILDRIDTKMSVGNKLLRSGMHAVELFENLERLVSQVTPDREASKLITMWKSEPGESRPEITSDGLAQIADLMSTFARSPESERSPTLAALLGSTA